MSKPAREGLPTPYEAMKHGPGRSAVGVIVAAALTRFMSGLLFGVTAADGLTYGAAALIVAMEALRWE